MVNVRTSLGKGHNIWLTSGNPDKLKTAVVKQC
jgi:hypothetical protein